MRMAPAEQTKNLTCIQIAGHSRNEANGNNITGNKGKHRQYSGVKKFGQPIIFMNFLHKSQVVKINIS